MNTTIKGRVTLKGANNFNQVLSASVQDIELPEEIVMYCDGVVRTSSYVDKATGESKEREFIWVVSTIIAGGKPVVMSQISPALWEQMQPFTIDGKLIGEMSPQDVAHDAKELSALKAKLGL
jgi:hypothetical protein